MDINTDIIGIGWSFPPAFNKAGGDVFMTTGEEDIRNSLQILLNTAFGERVMRSEYGCDLRRFLFDPANASMQAYIKKIVEEAILYFEPRIRPDKVTLDVTDGLMEINIEYFIKSTNSRSNYVYPFYLKEANSQ
jgi:phage baseplate assembly protein W